VLGLQLAQRLAHRRPTDTEARAQLVLEQVRSRGYRPSRIAAWRRKAISSARLVVTIGSEVERSIMSMYTLVRAQRSGNVSPPCFG
jgi:hypothetical protein